ncbi:jerky protein homolog-like [Rhizophagus irregularis DAOM 181602=DAOM 197198]|nr:jerky protein homolog-like [Rhizophagus irregularis DAOM 181602=DAOM 197198]
MFYYNNDIKIANGVIDQVTEDIHILDIANHFNEVYPNLTIDRSTISKILLQSDKWTAIINTEDSSKTFRHKAVKFPILDQAMNLWVENVTAGGVILTDLLIKEKAKIFAQAFNIQENELVFSNGWLYKFKQRNNIRRYHIHGESESAPLASLPEERTKLQQLLSRYILDQIYNIDETGLFYRMSPSQTLSTKPVPGRKKDKTRITVLLGANATGTDKLKPWVIGNAKRPRPLSKVNLERLPVFYRGVPDFPYEVFRITGN